ncbi:MAG: sigma-70 family RNA polymerase sigma factor [Ilumatobacteraceae bacterium]
MTPSTVIQPGGSAEDRYADLVATYPGLVRRALERDESAWRQHDSLSGVVWKTVNSFDLPQSDREDAYSSTFFKLFEHLSSIQEPRKLPGWLATTARNEARTICRKRQRQTPVADLVLADVNSAALDEAMLDDELTRATLTAFSTLSARDQNLLRLATAVPPISHKEIAELLDMPLGSVGPTMGRALSKLRAAMHGYRTGGTS